MGKDRICVGIFYTNSDTRCPLYNHNQENIVLTTRLITIHRETLLVRKCMTHIMGVKKKGNGTREGRRRDTGVLLKVEKLVESQN